MLNMNVVRKYAAFTFAGFFPVICFYTGLVVLGFLPALGLLFLGIIVGTIVGFRLINHPFRGLVEGKGILGINMDSTGTLTPFLLGHRAPYIVGKFKGQEINDVFDRNVVTSIIPPSDEQGVFEETEDTVTITISKTAYHRAKFGLESYPVLLWNDQIKSFMTKDFLSNQEQGAFAEHGVLYLGRKVEDLTNKTRDFARYIVESLRPKTDFFKSKLFIIILIVAAIIALALFMPAIIDILQGGISGVQTAASGPAQGIVTPA